MNTSRTHSGTVRLEHKVNDDDEMLVIGDMIRPAPLSANICQVIGVKSLMKSQSGRPVSVFPASYGINARVRSYTATSPFH